MKILLIQPPVRDFYHTKIRTLPLGLAYLAASLRQNKHTVEILDCLPPEKKRQIPIPESFAYMQKFYPPGDMGPFRLHSKYFHFGSAPNEIYERIRSSSPQVVGIACRFTPYFEESIETAAIVKSINPDTPVIFGGAHASALPQAVLKSPYVDYVVLGEGEKTLPELLAAIESGAPPRELDGIGYKENEHQHINPRKEFINDLDALPFPARDLLRTSDYEINGRPYTMLLTSRGCPQNCSYCSVGCVMGKTFRVRSPENILKEIMHCRDVYGISLFDIEDDNFTLDRRRTLRILDLIIEAFGQDEIRFVAMNGMSIISLDKKMLQKMKQAGFRYLDLSLGSSSVDLNRKMDRPFDQAKTESVLEHVNALAFPVTTYIILGMPGHRLEEMIDSIIYLMNKETFLGPSIFYPSPGSTIFEGLCRDGSLPGPDYSLLRSSVFPVQTAEFSRIDLITLLRFVRWVNFIKRLISLQDRKEITLKELRQKAVSQWWPAGVPKNKEGPLFLTALQPFKTEETGKILTAFFLSRRNFYGIRRLRSLNKGSYTYEIFPCETSPGVIRILSDRQDDMVIRAAVKKKTH